MKAAKTQTLITNAAFLGCWPLDDAGAAPGTYSPHIRRNNSEKSIIFYQQNLSVGGTIKPIAIQRIMKQPIDQEDRNEDKKKPEEENPSHGIDPAPEEPEMEAEKGN